jgi:hypothetical protein
MADSTTTGLTCFGRVESFGLVFCGGMTMAERGGNVCGFCAAEDLGATIGRVQRVAASRCAGD